MMNSTPRVSVIIAAYNAALTVERAIHSVLGGTCQTFEIILCDDASTDDTIAVVEAIESVHIRLFRNVTNLGPGPSRDRAIAAARGQWVTFLDADDEFAKGRLQKLLSVAEQHPDALIFDDIMRCHDKQTSMVPWRPFPRSNARPAYARPREISITEWLSWGQTMVQPLVPTALIREHDVRHSSLRYAEDLAYLLRLLAISRAPIWHVPEPLYLYRLRAGSLSTTSQRFSVLDEVYADAQMKFAGRKEIVHALDICREENQQNAAYRNFYVLARQGHLPKAALQAFRTPWLAHTFLSRSVGSIAYHFSRWSHGGAWRKKSD